MNGFKVISPMPPSVNHYTKVRTIIRNGKPVSIVYKTNEAKKYESDFKEIIKKAAKEQNWNIEINKYQHFYVDAVFYFDRTDKDASNYEKCLCDTITDTQLIWKDDNVVLFRPQRIFYDKNNPRIELYIYPVEYIGIFDTNNDLLKFEDKCRKCTRYGRNCSILKNAKSGHIQDEICFQYDCKKFKEKKEK